MKKVSEMDFESLLVLSDIIYQIGQAKYYFVPYSKYHRWYPFFGTYCLPGSILDGRHVGGSFHDGNDRRPVCR